MKMLKKLFGGIDMTWTKVILFAICAGVYTGVINMVPGLEDTSFRDIVVTTEWWVLFGVILASNCKKPLESGLKVFVFFLISQPLVYLVETPFLGAHVWVYYKYWALITLFTFPAGIIANYINKKNLLSALILALGLSIVAMNAAEYLPKVMNTFPHHLLTFIFCVAQIIIVTIAVVEKNSYRALTLGITAVVFVVLTVLSMNTKNQLEVILPEGTNWTCTFEEQDSATITVSGESFIYSYTTGSMKENTIHCVDSTGKTVDYKVEIEPNKTVNILEIN